MGYAGGTGGLVVFRDINLFSYCESCLLPFSSKLSRVADVFARRLQDPQRHANEICSALHNSIKPAGVAVALQCLHIQLPESLRCNSNSTSPPPKLDMQGCGQVFVSSTSGILVEEMSLWDNFFALLRLRGVVLERGDTSLSYVSWCPSRSLEIPLCNGHSVRSTKNGNTSQTSIINAAMVAAVVSILHSLGADPLRKELICNPYRYVHWLLNFTVSNWDLRLNSPNLTKVSPCGSMNGHFACMKDVQSMLNIPFCSQCEHHLLPFYGVVHIGYLVKQGVCIDRSVLQSMVHSFACKLQVQERLTRQIAEAVYAIFNKGVMVVVEAHHTCMISRGIEKVGSNTATIALLGQFSTDKKTKELFLRTIADSYCF